MVAKRAAVAGAAACESLFAEAQNPTELRFLRIKVHSNPFTHNIILLDFIFHDFSMITLCCHFAS